MPEAVSPPVAGLAHLVGRATGQSLTGGNRIEPLVDGEQAYPAMLAAIESARHSVALASYIFDSQGIGAQFVDALRRALLHAAGWQAAPEGVTIARARHVEALRRTRTHLSEARAHAAQGAAALELLAEELRLAHQALAEITGEFGSEDLLGEIFGRFCIGK